MGSVLLTLACAGRGETPLTIPNPLPNAVEFKDLTNDHALPVMYDTYAVRGLLGSTHAIKNTESYDSTQTDPDGQSDSTRVDAFVTHADGKNYPARADITILCPGGIPAYRLSNSGYASLTTQRSRTINPDTDFSNPAPLIGNPGAAFGSPQCYSRESITPYNITYSGGGGI